MNPDDISLAGGADYPADASLKINGPPGTGKTTQGLRRVYELVTEYGYDVWDVSWSTYRRSLARDVLGRLSLWNIIEPDELEDPHKGATQYVATAHANAYRISDNDRFTECDAVRMRDKWDFIRSKYNLAYSTDNHQTADYGELIFGVYYWCVNNEVSMSRAYECPEWGELQSDWSSHPDMETFEAEWEAYKEANDLVDYHEYLEYVRDNNICPPTPIVVIDEYHDVYPLMHSVCKMWVENADIAIVLGDPQQVVNYHEGADPAFFENLDLPEVKLQKTWRVPQNIWNVATDILAGWHSTHTPEFKEGVEGSIEKVRAPGMDYNQHTDNWETPTGEYGTPDWLAAEYGDESMLYLARTRKQVAGITESFEEAGVIYRSQIGTDWRDDDRRRHLFNALQRLRGVELNAVDWQEYEVVWADHAEDLGLDTSERPPQQMMAAELAYLIDYTPAKYIDGPRSVADDKARTLHEIDNRHYSIDELAGLYTDEFWREMTRGAASAHHLVNREGASALDTDVLYRTLVRNDSPTFEIPNQDPDYEDDDNKLIEDGLDDVPVAMTIHASKGSEATTAVIYAGITKRTRQSIRRNPELAKNEARTWYVALTRAQKRAVIVRDAFWWTRDYLPPALHRSLDTDAADTSDQ